MVRAAGKKKPGRQKESGNQMLYALHEFQKTITAPLAAWMDASHRLFSNPYSPLAYTPVSRHVAASSELLKRLMRSYHKPAWEIAHLPIGAREVPITVETVVRKPFCHLLHFRKHLPAPGRRVLIVAPLSGHHATLLRDTVRTMLHDFDVYVTD